MARYTTIAVRHPIALDHIKLELSLSSKPCFGQHHLCARSHRCPLQGMPQASAVPGSKHRGPLGVVLPWLTMTHHSTLICRPCCVLVCMRALQDYIWPTSGFSLYQAVDTGDHLARSLPLLFVAWHSTSICCPGRILASITTSKKLVQHYEMRTVYRRTSDFSLYQAVDTGDHLAWSLPLLLVAWHSTSICCPRRAGGSLLQANMQAHLTFQSVPGGGHRGPLGVILAVALCRVALNLDLLPWPHLSSRHLSLPLHVVRATWLTSGFGPLPGSGRRRPLCAVSLPDSQ